MKLPELPITLAIIAILWAVAGVWAHGWIMLAYPVMWALVGILFLGLNTAWKATPPADRSSPAKSLASASYGRTAEQSQRQHVA